MYEVNRSVFRLVPLQPFWDWLTAWRSRLKVARCYNPARQTCGTPAHRRQRPSRLPGYIDALPASAESMRVRHRFCNL